MPRNWENKISDSTKGAKCCKYLRNFQHPKAKFAPLAKVLLSTYIGGFYNV
jgi:hypothetical protein